MVTAQGAHGLSAPVEHVRLVSPTGTEVSMARWSRTSVLPTLETPTARLLRLRDSCDLTWDQVAALFGVSRRAVHFWAVGGGMSQRHATLLAHLLDVADQAGQAPMARKAALVGSPDRPGLLDELRQGRATTVDSPGAPYTPSFDA